jgi:hypothetical protein
MMEVLQQPLLRETIGLQRIEIMHLLGLNSF